VTSFRRSIGLAQGLAGHRVLLIALALTAAMSLLAVTPRSIDAAGTPLRQVDWPAVLANDPTITVDPDAYQLPGGNPGPYIRVTAPNGEEVQGYVTPDDILYGDLDGDGADEAVLFVYSGGTGGSFGFMVYREGTPDPKRALIYTGYKLGGKIEDGHLIVYEPYYVGFEANCCPSATVRTVNALNGNQLVALATEVQPNDVQEPTVWSFYEALSEKRYDDAYAFFSPAFKASNPFERWRAGYASTQSIEVETQPGTVPTEVLIDLKATDRQPGGGTVTRRFRGAWSLVWSGEQKRWLLDRAKIEQV
jgi:hypothetical protein